MSKNFILEWYFSYASIICLHKDFKQLPLMLHKKKICTIYAYSKGARVFSSSSK